MGWSVHSNTTLKGMIDYLTKRDLTCKEYRVRTLVRSLRGSVLWAVEEAVYHDQTRPPKRVIACYLLRRYGNTGEVGYKGMGEADGPADVSCPLSYLDMVTPVNDEWRDRVRAYHAKRGRKLAKGCVVTLNKGCTLNGKPIGEVVVESVKPLIGRDSETGQRFRFKRSQIDEIRLEDDTDDASTAPAQPQPQQAQLQSNLNLF